MAAGWLRQKDLGDKRMRNEVGEGSTPVLHGNTIVIVWDHINAQSFDVPSPVLVDGVLYFLETTYRRRERRG